MPGGRIGVLPLGVGPLRFEEVPLRRRHPVRGFRGPMATPDAKAMDRAGPGPALTSAWLRAKMELSRISPGAGDALLYFGSAVFALITIYTSENALYQVWGRMALSPFVVGA